MTVYIDARSSEHDQLSALASKADDRPPDRGQAVLQREGGMSQIAVWCVAGIIPLLATVSLLRYGVPAWVPPAKDVLQSGLKPATSPPLRPSTTRRPAEANDAEAGKPKFDVVRIDPDGVSVFAGRAAAESTVTVLANAMPIASPRADENGEWAVVLEHKFAAGDYQLSLGSEPGKPADGQTVRITIARTEPGPVKHATSHGRLHDL